MAATYNIAGDDFNFPCPVGWTVEAARNEIRSRYNLVGGGIDRDGVPLAASEVIGNTGVLTFVGGTSTLGKHSRIHSPIHLSPCSTYSNNSHRFVSLCCCCFHVLDFQYYYTSHFNTTLLFIYYLYDVPVLFVMANFVATSGKR